MKIYKLYTHQKSFNTADLVLNPREHPDAKQGDVVEIYPTDDEDCKLLLQITAFSDLNQRDFISIETTIATAFNLKTYSAVVMRLVNAADVALDSIEITFKDQYMGRSEMWRLKTHLTNTCVYINKKIDCFDKSIRCQVYEMWSQGDRVSCGVITEDTKIVFRSSTSMVYLFLQMSSEMWDFDIHGDLYFEKAVNGFLTELFTKWNKLGCNHEVTIVLFSRTFYAAKSLDEFPVHMRDCLQMDYKGRFYEDFYRVAIQNERNDDWCTILGQLRKLFTTYQSTVLRYHERENIKIPTATNSTAAQGNFLEVLNISLNTFEKHYLDRSFDRTGQLSVVLTPGVGVFEVDRELTNITKQRIIDNGVGSDLVCVGEQPLHAVPLLKFHNKDTSLTSADDYSLPHWINLSFYSTNKKVAYSTFIPRIKLTPLVAATIAGNENKKENTRTFLSCNQSEYIHNSLFDYDAYDAQIFQLPPAQGTCSLQRVVRAKKTSVPSLETYSNNNFCDMESFTPSRVTNRRRKMSDPDIHHGTSGVLSTLTGSPNLSDTIASDKNVRRSIVSIAPIVRPGRALINPFDPSHVTIKLTSNRRRWTHIFPKGPTGVLIQQHHYQAVPTKQLASSNYPVNGIDCYDNNNTENYSSGFNSSEYDHTSNCSSLSRSLSSSIGDDCSMDQLKKRNSHLSGSGTASRAAPAKSLTFLWGATGEQEWTPALTTGVDWKSLTIPACLPITTDYFPDKRSLHNDYVISDYTLLPDDVNIDYANSRAIYRKPLTTEEVFKEIVSQRLAQGFQLIVLEDKNQAPSQAPCCGGLKQKQQQQQQVQQQSSVLKTLPPSELTEEYLLSIGRIFHKISWRGSVITVTGYKPRHPYPPINVDYRYRFHAPQHDTYEISGVNFTTEKLEHFNWNYMDHYICTRGDTDYLLLDSLKYWRYRMYLLPKDIVAMNKILEHGCLRCDIYTEPSPEAAKQQIDDFLKFVEVHLNKIKRIHNRKARDSPTAPSHLTRRRHSTSIISRAPPNQGLGNSPFRERVGSNRLPDKRPRPLSSSSSRSSLDQHPHHRSRPPATKSSNFPFYKLRHPISCPKHATNRIIEKQFNNAASFISRAGTKPLERGRISPAADAAVIALNSEINVNEDRDDAFLSEVKLRPNATLAEIFEAMKHPITGVGFFEPTQGLPSCTFVSYDALMWLKTRLDGTKNPLDILEAMRKERMICHASGDWNKPVVPGFYLYFIGVQDKKDFVPPLNDLCAFENEWVEVELQGFKPMSSHELAVQEAQNKIPNFLRSTPPPQTWCNIQRQRNIYKHSHLEIDVNKKSDRMEWGHVKYHSVMQPGHAFEIVVEWVTASGPIVYDLIYGWQRKAQQCGFQLMPVPADPLAEPFTEKSDPLRGPIFIPLNTCFLGNDEMLFEEFAEETRGDRMLLFQEAILTRYGFMPCVVKNNISLNKDLPKEYQYVHCSGNMFVLIRCSKGNQQIESPSRQEGNVTRLVYGHTSHTNVPKKVGFLWSWNHMIANKKWKSLIINCSPDGELFQLKMLKDFREFCSNQDQRLKKFWDSCYELKNAENASDKTLRT